MPSESPGSKVRPEPASESSRWNVCLLERLPFRLTQLGDLGRERMRLAIGGRCGRGREIENHGAALLGRLGFGDPRELLERALRPVRGQRLVVEIAVDPRGDALAAELGQTGIDPPADLAEVDVAGIAERQHAEADALEAGRILGHQRPVELDRALRRIALAPGAGDHQEVRHARDLGRTGLGHVDQARGKSLARGDLLRLGRDPFGIAGFGREQDGQRDLGPCPGERRRDRQRGRGVVAREKAREPVALLEVGLGHHGVERPDVLAREGRALGQDGQRRAGHRRLLQSRAAERSAGAPAMLAGSVCCQGARIAAEPDDAADHDQRRPGPVLEHGRSGERRDRLLRARRGRIAKDRDRLLGRAPRSQQLGRDLGQAPEPHVEHDRLGTPGERLPVDRARRAAARVMARDEGDRLGAHPMGRGNAGVGGCPDAGRHARHDPERHAGRRECQGLLAAAAEHERIAALEPDHPQAGAGELDQALIDPELLRARPAGPLADRLEARCGPAERQDLGRDQRVVEDHVGRFERVHGIEGQETRIAGPGADQPDRAGREVGSHDLSSHG